MKTTKRFFIGMASLAVAAVTAYGADVATNSYRTTGYFIGLAQGADPISGHPEYVHANFAGHNLVNLAMGRAASNTVPSQVMAMTFTCDLSSASLVAYDEKTSNVVATIAKSTTMDSVEQQDPKAKGPNHAHFVAVLQIGPNGNDTNGLAGGYFTVAGRVNLNPETGCPQPVLVVLDRDPLDRLDDDVELPAKDDPDSVPLIFRTGLAHAIGVVDAVTDGETNTILVPYGGLSIRRELSGGPSVTPTPTAAN